MTFSREARPRIRSLRITSRSYARCARIRTTAVLPPAAWIRCPGASSLHLVHVHTMWSPMLGRLLPRDEQFFELFNQLAAHLATAAKMLDSCSASRTTPTELVEADQGRRAQGRRAHATDQSAHRQELHHADRPRGHPPAGVAARRRDRPARRHGAPRRDAAHHRGASSRRSSWRTSSAARGGPTSQAAVMAMRKPAR